MTISHTIQAVGTSKIAISIDAELLDRVDKLVAERRFPSRSRAIQLAVKAQIDRLDHTRLLRELTRADPAEEMALAEEGLAYDAGEWPEY
jgi:Arc/MetJ-type ribon-helix-helix transcriptional regulator